jgi:hypothetical protein
MTAADTYVAGLCLIVALQAMWIAYVHFVLIPNIQMESDGWRAQYREAEVERRNLLRDFQHKRRRRNQATRQPRDEAGHFVKASGAP